MVAVPSSTPRSISFADDYQIKPPTTINDDGKPSSSLLKDMQRTLALIEDERHFAAFDLYQSVKKRLAEFAKGSQQENSEHGWSLLQKKKASEQDAKENDYQAARNLLDSKRAAMDDLEKKTEVLQQAREKVNADSDWIFSQTMFGVSTFYRREADGRLSVKMEGHLEGVSLIEQIAVLREVDLHYLWAPYCSTSTTIKHLNKLDQVASFMGGLPQFGLARDGVFRAIGCDNMMEDGSFILVGQGLADRPEDEPYAYPYLTDVPDDLDIPSPPARGGRVTIREFSAIVRVLSPTSFTTKVVANVNPNFKFLPQALIDFVMRKLCGVMIAKLQNAAMKAHEDPMENIHAQRMQCEKQFYKGWLMAKFRAYYDRMKWAMPPVPAFEVDEIDVDVKRHLSKKESHCSCLDKTVATALSSAELVRSEGDRDDVSDVTLPKVIAEDQRGRLEELKKDKAGSGILLNRLHEQGWGMRVIVTAVVVASLFVSLVAFSAAVSVWIPRGCLCTYGEVEASTWRCEVIGMSQVLLSYMTVFLLSCLVLFYMLTKSRGPVEESNFSEKTPCAFMSSQDAGTPSLLPTTFEEDDEDSEVDIMSFSAPEYLGGPALDVDSSTKKKKKKRWLRLRFWRKRRSVKL